MPNTKITLKHVFVIFIPILILTLAIWQRAYYKKKFMPYSFNGIVDTVYYGQSDSVVFTIDNRPYLFYNDYYHFYRIVKSGDTLVKTEGRLPVVLKSRDGASFAFTPN
jgi:hypothetical protein